MHKPSRRTILLGSLAGLFGARLLYKWYWGDPTQVIEAILTRRVGHLRVEAKAFSTFAAAYLKSRAEHEDRLRHLSTASLALQFFTPYTWLGSRHPLRRLENNVVSMFLLSTDFFQNGADETRAVSYVAFYDPTAAICRNPFVNQNPGLG
jgi:hypothetical protein